MFLDPNSPKRTSRFVDDNLINPQKYLGHSICISLILYHSYNDNSWIWGCFACYLEGKSDLYNSNDYKLWSFCLLNEYYRLNNLRFLQNRYGNK
jgi:hypothetical protein